ncbi:MAG: hypothetical protein QXW57_04235 [Candidatus Micrarchaeaceae archaeon]
MNKIGMYSALIAIFGLLQISVVSASQCLTTGVNFKVLNVMWGNSTQQISVGPGSMDVPLTVQLESYPATTGTICGITNVEGQLQLYGGYSNFNGSAYATDYIAQLSPSQMFNMVFYLNVAKNVSAGPNASSSYYLYIYYNYTNDTARNNQVVNVEIPMHGSPNLTYTPETSTLYPGLNNLTIKLANTGSGAVYYISTYIESSSGFSVLKQPTSIGALYPGTSQNINALLYVAPGGSAPLTLTIDSHYISPYGVNTSAKTNIGMYTSQLQQNISVYPSSLTMVAGRLYNNTIIISNGGDMPIYNVSLTLSPQSPLDLISKSASYMFNIIPANSKVELPLSFYAQASSSSVVATLGAALTYTLNGQVQTASYSMAFLTPGYINLTDVSTSMLPARPIAGEIFTLTSTIENIGAESAVAASVTSYPPNGINIVGSNTSFIGTIPIDTPTAFTLTFMPSPSIKPGIYSIPVKISYLNNLNQHLNTSFVFSVDIGSGNATAYGGAGRGTYVTAGSGGYPARKSSSSSGVLDIAIVIVVVAVAVCIAAYYAYAKRKRRVRK